MPHRIAEMLGGFPFLLMATEDKRSKVNWARIIEALIIAAIGGILSGYIAVQSMKVEIAALTKQVDKIDQRVYDHITHNQ